MRAAYPAVDAVEGLLNSQWRDVKELRWRIYEEADGGTEQLAAGVRPGSALERAVQIGGSSQMEIDVQEAGEARWRCGRVCRRRYTAVDEGETLDDGLVLKGVAISHLIYTFRSDEVR